MKAFTKTTYGGPEVLRLAEVEKPAVREGHVLVRVRANSVNPADWHILRGEPKLSRLAFGLFKPAYPILGADFAGVVEAVGSGVTHFRVGDRVFGEALHAAFAEYVCAPAEKCGKMPDGAGFAEMAAMPIAGVTALQALVEHGKLRAGESVLINGSSGGVGHLAVQLAKALGATVTAVCSARNADFVRSFGADQVIAYDQEDIHQHRGRYDLILDTNGNLTGPDYLRMGRRGVVVGFTTLGQFAKLNLQVKIRRFPLISFTAKANTRDLETLARLMQEGKLRVLLEKTYAFTELPDAIRYIEGMRTRGKVGVVWE